MGLDVSAMQYKFFTDASGFDTNQVTGTFADVVVQDLIAGGNVFANGTVHASKFELDLYPSGLSYTSIGNEFDPTMRSAIMKHALPTGSIIMWHDASGNAGNASNIPAGYKLCNGGTYTNRDGGSQTTPDFRGRFIVGEGNNAGGNYTAMLGGSHSKTTSDASNAAPGPNQVAVNTSAFTIDNHQLSIGQLPQHKHGMNHGHSSVNINTFTAAAGYFSVNTAHEQPPLLGSGSHQHTLTGLEHDHYFGGDDHLKDANSESGFAAAAANFWPDATPVKEDPSNKSYDWESGRSDRDEGVYAIYRTSQAHGPVTQSAWLPTVGGTGMHNHSIYIARSDVAGSLSSASGSVPESYVTNPWNEPNATGQGADHGLKSPADGHNHGTSGQITLDNYPHTHTIADITPPWRSTTFIQKM
jgi:hypothetical protein